MPYVENRVIIEEVSLDTVWQVMCDFEAFPQLMQDVLEVKCFERAGDTLKSSWRVLLNGSELTWVEWDQFIDRREIRFHQIEGDLEVWEGNWRIGLQRGAVVVDLSVRFDLGIPSLAHILDPIGIRAITANSRQMLEAINRNSRVPVA
jgi:uncharacterized membrane protein